jgi:hypothetical protein
MAAAKKNEAKATKDEQPEEQKPTTGHDSEASDLDNPEVVANLSPEGQEAAEELGPEAKELADAALDASGPLHLQSPDERVATGAVNEEHAKEQEEAQKNVPDDYTGDVTESGLTASEPVHKEQEDVIDFPPPLAERENAGEEFSPDEPKRLYAQKSVFYTDGLSGEGDHNLERAYKIPRVLKSSNDSVREAGEESDSKASEEDSKNDEG